MTEGTAGGLHAATSGLVGEFQFSCVPAVPAGVSMLLVVLLQLPAVVLLLRQPHCHAEHTAQRETQTQAQELVGGGDGDADVR